MGTAEATFDRLIAEHQERVLRVCRSILRDDHLGDDAAQETFVRLWKRLSAGAAPEKTSAWLRRVAVTTSLDHMRSRKRSEVRERIRRVEPPPEASDPGTELEARELAQRFERALERLSEGQRTVFLLRHSAGVSLPEIARTLDVSLPTVKTHFARACLRLQELLTAFQHREDETQ